MAKSAYVEKMEGQINDLCVQKKYREAFKLSDELVANDPGNKDLLKLRIKVQKAAQQENQNLIDSKLKELKPLWKEKNYREILIKLSPILKIAPRNEKLLRNVKKAQDKYKDSIRKAEESFFKKYQKKFKKLLGKNNDQILEELFTLEKENAGNHNILKFTNSYRNSIISNEIERQRELLGSNKFQAIYKFYFQTKKYR